MAFKGRLNKKTALYFLFLCTFKTYPDILDDFHSSQQNFDEVQKLYISAIDRGYLEAAEFLFVAGANPNASPEFNNTILSHVLAQFYNTSETEEDTLNRILSTLKLVLRHGSNPNTYIVDQPPLYNSDGQMSVSPEKQTPLGMVIQYLRIIPVTDLEREICKEIAKALLEAGANPLSEEILYGQKTTPLEMLKGFSVKHPDLLQKLEEAANRLKSRN